MCDFIEIAMQNQKALIYLMLLFLQVLAKHFF